MDDATQAQTSPVGADEVFLSPRIIDQEAFEDFGKQLRELVEALSDNAINLRTSLSEATSLRAKLESVTRQDRERLDSASELLLYKLDERAARVERALAQADRLDEIGKSIEGEADRLLGTCVSELEKRMAQSLASFSSQLQAQLDTFNSQSSVLLEKMKSGCEQMDQHIDQKVSQTLDALREQCDQAAYFAGERERDSTETATGRLAEMIERASSAHCDAKDAMTLLDDADGRTGDLESRIAGAVESAALLLVNLETERDKLGDTLISVTETALETRASLTRDLDRANLAQRSIQTESQRADGLIAKVVEQTKEAQAAQASLADAKRWAQETSHDLEAALATLEPWRTVLLEPDSQSGLPEPIAALVREMRAELGTDLLTLTEAMRQVAQRARAPQPTSTRRADPPQVEPKIVICTSEPPPVPAWGAD